MRLEFDVFTTTAFYIVRSLGIEAMETQSIHFTIQEQSIAGEHDTKADVCTSHLAYLSTRMIEDICT